MTMHRARKRKRYFQETQGNILNLKKKGKINNTTLNLSAPLLPTIKNIINYSSLNKQLFKK